MLLERARELVFFLRFFWWFYIVSVETFTYVHTHVKMKALSKERLLEEC